MNGLIPQSKSGWWTGWLIAAFGACYILGGLMAALAHNSASPGWRSAPTAIALAGSVCVLGAVVAGIAALLHKDRSAPVLVAIGLGGLIAVFLACRAVIVLY